MIYRIKSTKYNTYYTGGKSVKNPHYDDSKTPKGSWQDNKSAWESWYAERRKLLEAYQAEKSLTHIESDDLEGHLELMKKHNIDHEYLRFDKDGKVFNTKRAAETKLSMLTKTTKKIRSKVSTHVLYGNEKSARWKIVASKLVDIDET